jgi:hypothetical protein
MAGCSPPLRIAKRDSCSSLERKVTDGLYHNISYIYIKLQIHVLVVQFGGFLKWGTPILGNLHLVDVDHGPHPWLPLHGTPAPMEAAIDVVNARVVHALRASLTFVDWFYKVGPIVIGK